MKVFVFMVSLSTVFGAPLLAQEASPARPRQELYHELVQRIYPPKHSCLNPTRTSRALERSSCGSKPPT